MKIINKKVCVTVFVILIVMLAIVFVRQKDMISQYCNISEETVVMGDCIEYDGYLISVTKASIWDDAAYYKQLGPGYEDFEQDIIYAYEGARVVELIIHVERMAEVVNENLSIYGFFLISGANVIGADYPLAQELNDRCDNFYFDDIEPGESCDYIIPYFAYESGFTKTQWNDWNSLGFELILDIYPVKKTVMVDNIENHIDYEYENLVTVTGTEEVSETENTTVENDNTVVGMNEIKNIYDVGSCATLDGVQYSISDVSFIYNLEDINTMPETGIYSSLYPYYRDNYFDQETGMCLPEMDRCYVKYTVNVENLTDDAKRIDVSACSIVDETNYLTQCTSELLYCSEYNRTDSDIHQTYMIELQAGESLNYTVVGALYGYDNYDKETLYCKLFTLGCDVESGSYTNDMYGCYIELDMRGSDTDG